MLHPWPCKLIRKRPLRPAMKGKVTYSIPGQLELVLAYVQAEKPSQRRRLDCASHTDLEAAQLADTIYVIGPSTADHLCGVKGTSWLISG